MGEQPIPGPELYKLSNRKTLKRRNTQEEDVMKLRNAVAVSLLLMVQLVGLVGCGGGSSAQSRQSPQPPQSSPPPSPSGASITISPTSAVAGSPDLTLT